jgi:hypothetical protein
VPKKNFTKDFNYFNLTKKNTKSNSLLKNDIGIIK